MRVGVGSEDMAIDLKSGRVRGLRPRPGHTSVSEGAGQCLHLHMSGLGHTLAGGVGRGLTGFKNGTSEFAKLGNVSIAVLSWHL